MRFAVPYNGDPGVIERLAGVRHLIGRVFLPIPLGFMATGRPWSLGQPEAYRRELPGLVRAIAEAGFAPEVLCNSSMPKWTEVGATVRYLGRLVDSGLRHVTIAYLPLASRVHREIPGIEITASTVADIHEGARLDRWIEEAGITTVVPDRSLNKRLDALRALKRSGLTVSLVVDDGCMPSCPIQSQHYAIYQYCDRRHALLKGSIESSCRKWLRSDTWRVWQSDIVPGDLPRFEGVVDLFKFGRDSRRDTDRLLAEVAHYAGRASRQSFFGGHVEPEEVFDRLQACDRLCSRCGWCRDAFLRVNRPTSAPEGRSGEPLWEPRT